MRLKASTILSFFLLEISNLENDSNFSQGFFYASNCFWRWILSVEIKTSWKAQINFIEVGREIETNVSISKAQQYRKFKSEILIAQNINDMLLLLPKLYALEKHQGNCVNVKMFLRSIFSENEFCLLKLKYQKWLLKT